MCFWCKLKTLTKYPYLCRMKKLLFIINPIAGSGDKQLLPKLIEQHIDHAQFHFDLAYTEYAGHASEISKENTAHYDAIIAVGGDGTVNEVGKTLLHSTTPLGIIPWGSGDGLARHLNIPMRPDNAIKTINRFQLRTIDTGMMNNTPFLNVSGVGFDGYISRLFAKEKSRGILRYGKLIMQKFMSYTAQEYDITVDGQTWNRKAFLIAFANSSQWGNNLQIAPQATIDDGLIDICIIQDFPKHLAPFIGINLLTETLHKTRYDEIIQGTTVELSSSKDLVAHIDGEPIKPGKKIKVQITPRSLKIIC